MTRTGEKPRRLTRVDLNLAASQFFADVFQAYLECSNEVQAAIRDMVQIIKSPDATGDECESALATIADALFPSRSNGDLGIDYDGEFAGGSSPDIKRLLERMKEEEATFGKRLGVLLEAKTMSQGELAAQLGIGQSAVSMMIARDCRPQRRTIEKIAQVLKVSPEDLWPGFKEED